MFAQIAKGHVDAADLLFLLAAILFALDGVLRLTRRPDPSGGSLVPFGLTLVALAFLIE